MHPRLFGLLLLTVAACSQHRPVESRDVATRDLSASVVVTHLSDGTPHNRVEVTLTAPGGYFVLAETDRLQVTVATTTTPLAPAAGPYGVVYRADVADLGGDYLLDLLRGGERSDDHDIVGAAVTVPPTFTLTLSGAEISRRSPLIVTWDAAVGRYEVALSIAGPCFVGLTRKLSSDTGTYLVNPAELADAATRPGDTCDATVTMTRDATNQGELIAGGGALYARSTTTRTAAFRSTP